MDNPEEIQQRTKTDPPKWVRERRGLRRVTATWTTSSEACESTSSSMGTILVHQRIEMRVMTRTERESNCPAPREEPAARNDALDRRCHPSKTNTLKKNYKEGVWTLDTIRAGAGNGTIIDSSSRVLGIAQRQSQVHPLQPPFFQHPIAMPNPPSPGPSGPTEQLVQTVSPSRDSAASQSTMASSEPAVRETPKRQQTPDQDARAARTLQAPQSPHAPRPRSTDRCTRP